MGKQIDMFPERAPSRSGTEGEPGASPVPTFATQIGSLTAAEIAEVINRGKGDLIGVETTMLAKPNAEGTALVMRPRERGPVEVVPCPPEPRDPHEAGRQARDHAIERVGRGAPTEWMKRAHEIIRKVASRQGEFTADDLWGEGLEVPPEPRALGAAMMQAVRDHICERTGRFVQTKRRIRHAAPIAVWRSLIWRV